MCRVCLIQDTNMKTIIGTKLERLYEMLTAMPFQAGDNRPLQICYICYARLQNCYRLQMNCIKSEKLLSTALANNLKPTLLKNTNTFQIVHPNIHPNIHLNYISTSLMEPDDKDDDDKHIEKHDDPKEIICDVHIKEEVIEDEQDNNFDYDGNIEYLEPETIVKIERDDTDYDDISNHSIHNEEELSIEEKREELKAKLFLQNFDGGNGQRKNHSSNSVVPMPDNFIKPVKIILKRENLNRFDTGASAMKEEAKPVWRAFTHSTTSNQRAEIEKDYKKFTEENTLQNNSGIDIHNVEKPYICEVCQKCFAKKRHLTEHERIHTGEELYRCYLCDKSFNTICNLTQHKLNMHTREYGYEANISNADNPYRCKLCPKTYKHKNGLMRHTRMHTNDRPYVCEICEKGFTVKEVLKNHMRVHFDEKLYKCDVCEKSFKIKSTLNSHKLIHTGVKPFKCNICHKSFTLNGDLTKHVRIHTGEKPYKCDICDKSFKRHSDVVGHRRIHTGEKPFKCDLCDRRFTARSTLNSHRRTHK